jgi:hypothetical protein
MDDNANDKIMARTYRNKAIEFYIAGLKLTREIITRA